MKTQDSPQEIQGGQRVKFPFKKKNGNVTATIYQNWNPLREAKEYKLAYYDLAGKRRFRSFPDFKSAKAELDGILDKAARGEMETLEMDKAGLVAYTRAVKALEPYQVPVDAAAESYAEILKILSGHATPIEAVHYFVKCHPHALPVKSVQEVFDELLAAKKTAGKSAIYIMDLRYRCGAFARTFQCPIASVTTADIRRFLAGLKLSPRSHNNFIRAINTLFEFAESRDYLLESHNVMKGIERQEETGEEIEIFTPDQMSKLLAGASAEVRPVIAIGGFAGLRTAEILRLDWSEIHLAERFIEIKKSKAKTPSRRLAPICDALALWLAPYAQQQGRVWPHSVAFAFEALEQSAGKAGVAWKHNALRHSFISYRLAETKNDNQVALEAGNSPAMIQEHYRGLVTEQQAKTWLALAPKEAGNVVPMPAAIA